MLFQMRGMRCAVGTQKEPVAARRHGMQQCLAMNFSFEHRQAVIVRPHAPQKQGIAVEQQMVRCDGGCGVGPGLRHILRGLAGGDVFQHDFQLRKVTAQRRQVLVDEHGLAVEHINLGISHFAMNQQGHAQVLHGFEGFVGMA